MKEECKIKYYCLTAIAVCSLEAILLLSSSNAEHLELTAVRFLWLRAVSSNEFEKV